MNRPEPLALVFHNFTPADLLLHWDPAVAFELLKAQDQLSDLVEKSVFAICDSDFNAQVLSEFGQVEQYVIPLPVEASPRFEMTSGVQPTILFVGRIAPNKGIHDLIAAISVLRQRLPEVRLRVVGASTTESYDRAIRGLIDALELSEVVSLTGWIDDEQLDKEYRQASVFCTLSPHPRARRRPAPRRTPGGVELRGRLRECLPTMSWLTTYLTADFSTAKHLLLAASQKS